MTMAQDRLVRKEVALGVVREMPQPEDHIGTRLLAPFRDVESDDVIFDYAPALVAGLAPARAEDAESELAQKDETVGYGRAAIIDWALKDHYDPSDVTRYRELTQLGSSLTQGSFPLTIGRMTEGFQAKLARDTRIRRRKLDNRFEWLITQALETGGIAYNDGKIVFSVNFGRPSDQTNDDVSSGSGEYWNHADSDPIGDLLARQEAAEDRYGVTLNRAIISRKVWNSLMSSDKFQNMLIGSNPLYTVEGWGPDRAARIVSQQTNIEFIVYDSVYRTRALGSTTWVNNRFLSPNKVYLLPSAADIEQIDDTIGFGATLTSPHPEGEWQTGFYEWEQSTKDPWGYDIGTGCKAFPVFPHLDLTWTMVVLPAA
jgi:hypothetical protein